jgi:hypothetical protein
VVARILPIAVCVWLSGCVATGTPGPAHYQPATPAAVAAHFTATEARIIRDYYESHAPDKKKNGKSGLPPGIAKNLARGKPLPPGIAKQYLPGDLVRQLPPAPAGYERIIVTGKILLVEIATQVVHDVLTDAMFG